MSNNFGAGPLLTKELDFELTTTGDLEVTRGSDELQKDIALQLLIQFSDLIGSPKFSNASAKISSRTEAVLNDEPRVDSITSIDVRLLDDANEAEVVAEVVGDGTTQELVFTI